MPDGVIVLAHELATANRLIAIGYNVEFRTPSNVEGVKNPDILLNGEIWEMKSPEGSGKHNISDQMKRAGKQSRRMVLDLARSPLDELAVISEVRHRLKGNKRLDQVLIIRRDGTALELSR